MASVILDTLRRAIPDSGESLNAIGRATGIQVSSLCRFVNGEHGLSVEAAEVLAAYLGVSITVKRPKRKRG